MSLFPWATSVLNFIGTGNTTVTKSGNTVTINSSGGGSSDLSTLKNRLFNGEMRLDSYNAGGSQTFTAGAAAAYCIDRFYGSCTGANITGKQIAGTSPDGNYYQFTGAASNTGFVFGQKQIGDNTTDMVGSPAFGSVVLAASNLTTLTWTAYYASALNNFATKTQIATGTFTVNSTPTLYTTPSWGTLPSGAANGVAFEISGGAVLATQTVTMGRFMVNKGSAAATFEWKSKEQDIDDCQYFREMSYDYAVKPGTASSLANSGLYTIGQANAAQGIQFKKTKFSGGATAGTLHVYSPVSGTIDQVYNNTSSASIAAGYIGTLGNNTGSFFPSGTATAGSQIEYHYVAHFEVT